MATHDRFVGIGWIRTSAAPAPDGGREGRERIDRGAAGDHQRVEVRAGTRQALNARHKKTTARCWAAPGWKKKRSVVMGTVAQVAQVVAFPRPAIHRGRPHTLWFARSRMQKAIIESPAVTTEKELLVLLVLAGFMHPDGTGMRPSVARLAKAARLSEKTVTRTLAALREKQVIVATSPTTGGLRPTRYDFGFQLRECLSDDDAGGAVAMPARPDTLSGHPGHPVPPPRTQCPPKERLGRDHIRRRTRPRQLSGGGRPSRGSL